METTFINWIYQKRQLNMIKTKKGYEQCTVGVYKKSVDP